MNTLSIRVSGEERDARLSTIPFKVLSSYGAVLYEGFADTARQDISFQLPSDGADDVVHVATMLPNGQRKTVPVNLVDGRGEVVLLDRPVPDPVLGWVNTFRALDHLEHALQTESEDHPLKDVWMTLWRFVGGNWNADHLSFETQLRDDDVRQICLDVPDELQILQLGGSRLAWRLIVLPPRSRSVRVALTRKKSYDDESVDVTVARSNPTNELIMSYLAGGAFDVVGKLGALWGIADEALYLKDEDPVAAAAGAYVLYRLNRLDGKESWVENLDERFPFMADGGILRAAIELRRDDPDIDRARLLVQRALRRGLPVFRIGASILVEIMAYLHRGGRRVPGKRSGDVETKRFHDSYLAAQAYLGAEVKSGIYYSFYGRSPVLPSWEKEFGSPETPSKVSKRHFLPPSVSYGGVRVYLEGAASGSSPGAAETAGGFGSLGADRMGYALSEASEVHLPPSRIFGFDRTSETLNVDSTMVEVEVSAKPRRTRSFWRDQRLNYAVGLSSDDPES